MAEAFLQVILDNLSSLIQGEIGLILGVDKEMKKLSSVLTAIQAVLADAEDKQLQSHSIRNWLRKLNNLAYEIDDLLDECAIEVSKMKKNNRKYKLKKILFQRKIGRRMKEVAEKIDDVAAERQNFHLREMPIEKQTEITTRCAKRETGSVLNKPDHVYGRDEEREKIVNILVNRVKDCQELSVLPLLGLGGLGKTTLAQLVYNDQRIKDHFQSRIWVCVSDDFDPKILIKMMIESVTGSGNASNLMELDTLQRRLCELLNQKRYLLILDDVWNENQEKWVVLKNVLTCGAGGASVVITTRLQKVADIMGTLPPHCLMGLSEEHCWSLFKQCAFGHEIKEYPNLEPIGRKIVKKCVGVPLAAKTLGGLLRFKRKEKEWICVQESEMWNLQQEETSILPALRLSYLHLPLTLRRCFAYCALFPKDWIIKKEELIFRWIAHGCISSDRMQEVEDVGDEVWNELALRSLFQEVNITDEGKTTFRMHDLVHDLALSILENKIPTPHADSNHQSASNCRIREVYFYEYSSKTFPTSIQFQVPTLTSLMNYSHCRMLRAHAIDLPSLIGKLKHLRQLNLSRSSIRTLPNTICGLWNLQILNLNGCYRLVSLPKNLRYLNNLCHLLVESCHALIDMPPKIGEITSLKTLSLFIVGHKIGNQLSELECLNVGGTLEIRNLERVKNHLDARKAKLVEKPNLRELVLKWGGDNDFESQEMMDEMVLEALEPHPNIEILQILCFKGRSFPAWMENSTMANVVRIDISGCLDCLHLPPLGDLPRLKRSTLIGLGIEYIVEDDVQGRNPITIKFRSLEELELWHLHNLKGLLKEEVREMFPNLQQLKISFCTLLRLPPLSSLKGLHIDGCSQLNLSSLSRYDNLTYFQLGMDETSMACIPNETLESLSNLKRLEISNVDEHILPIEGQGIQCLKSLTSLRIGMRETVTCFAGEWLQHFTTLEELEIDSCKDLVELPEGVKYLQSLKSLRLQRLPKLVCLPERLQHLHSLQRLSLCFLDQLISLPDWLGNLMSLERLWISSCPRIASLPSSIQGKTNLKRLLILYCPILKRRCKKGKGEDWHKIAHIPDLQIH